jgi:hypothetical protein
VLEAAKKVEALYDKARTSDSSLQLNSSRPLTSPLCLKISPQSFCG